MWGTIAPLAASGVWRRAVPCACQGLLWAFWHGVVWRLRWHFGNKKKRRIGGALIVLALAALV